MNRRKISGLLAVLLTLSVAIAGAAAGGRGDPPRHPNDVNGAIHRSFEWQEPGGDGQAAGLYLNVVVPAGMISRILVLGPEGRAIRITSTLDPRRGVQTGELLDESTGWWARLEVRLGIRADSLGAYFAASEELGPVPWPHKASLRFAASGASPGEAELAVAEPAVLYTGLAEALAASGAGGEMVAHLPAGLAEAVLFLDSSVSPTPLPRQAKWDNLAYGARGVFEVLAKLLRAVPPEGLDVAGFSAPWTVSVGPFQKGTSSSDPEILELVSHFASVENADPLSDHRAAEVFGDPHPPER